MDRRNREAYDEWVALAREAKAPEEQIEQYVTEQCKEAAEIMAGRCPKCGAPVRHDADPRQVGPPSEDIPGGAWIMYWCSTDIAPGTWRAKNVCGFRVDWYEIS